MVGEALKTACCCEPTAIVVKPNSSLDLSREIGVREVQHHGIYGRHCGKDNSIVDANAAKPRTGLRNQRENEMTIWYIV